MLDNPDVRACIAVIVVCASFVTFALGCVAIDRITTKMYVPKPNITVWLDGRSEPYKNCSRIRIDNAGCHFLAEDGRPRDSGFLCTIEVRHERPKK